MQLAQLFYPSDQYHQARKLIDSSIPNFLIDLSNIVNEYFIVELRVGTKLDCKDELGMWLIAQVMEVAKENGQIKFYIHYCGWRHSFDEWIQMQSVCSRFDVLNEHTPVDEDLIMSPDFTGLSSAPFYMECPSASQRKALVRRISERGLPADAVTCQYERFQWNRSPYTIFRQVLSDFPERSVCRCTSKNPMCAFCSLKLR